MLYHVRCSRPIKFVHSTPEARRPNLARLIKFLSHGVNTELDSKNQLTSEGGFPCTYDSNGNLTQIGNSLSSIGIMVYSYDDENRLTEVYTNYNSPGQGPSTAAWQTDFVYDGLGRMRKRLDYAGGLLQGTTIYIYDGWRVIQERDGATGTPIASFTRGSDLSGSLEGAGGIGGLLARSDTYSGGNWLSHDYYFADGNGNITYLLDSSQSLAASYRYDPFGNVISSSGSLWALNRYRFSSKEIHGGSGMYYYGYRFYDPGLRRWINRDPLSEAGGINLYGFAYNDSVGNTDANGLDVNSPPVVARPPPAPRPPPTAPRPKPAPKPQPGRRPPSGHRPGFPGFGRLSGLCLILKEILDPPSLGSNPTIHCVKSSDEVIEGVRLCIFTCDDGNDEHHYGDDCDKQEYWKSTFTFDP
jgi:RHS repeat-associated protein